ncbi:hypothetical protein IFR04_015720 [Cadophora malorum]|uniref:Transmembrane protein n=1 Tax=Cadophora malorum TaxID=108018 RepID=A0A8H7W516_9HELO|nr:hypothetical protein IFR04_015720 [Cadophora malorum]
MAASTSVTISTLNTLISSPSSTVTTTIPTTDNCVPLRWGQFLALCIASVTFVGTLITIGSSIGRRRMLGRLMKCSQFDLMDGFRGEAQKMNMPFEADWRM